MTCIICGERFYINDPEQDCSCGHKVSRSQVDSIDPCDLDEMRDEWREYLMTTEGDNEHFS